MSVLVQKFQFPTGNRSDFQFIATHGPWFPRKIQKEMPAKLCSCWSVITRCDAMRADTFIAFKSSESNKMSDEESNGGQRTATLINRGAAKIMYIFSPVNCFRRSESLVNPFCANLRACKRFPPKRNHRSGLWSSLKGLFYCGLLAVYFSCSLRGPFGPIRLSLSLWVLQAYNDISRIGC